ncbi:MAG: TlpA family protein disulfide reductase [Spirochaetota bacterium]|nr:TlpA family protein disulfide reductase [Spirochaetota bacterium]
MRKLIISILIIFFIAISLTEINLTLGKDDDNYLNTLKIMQKNKFDVPSKKTLAPDFSVTDFNGKKHSLKDYRGKIIFLNFWATWCGPCVWEMPSIEKLNKKMAQSNFVILAISHENKETVKKFITSKDYNFNILIGSASNKYGVRGIPTTFIIDKNGYVLGRAVGSRDWSTNSIINLFKLLVK